VEKPVTIGHTNRGCETSSGRQCWRLGQLLQNMVPYSAGRRKSQEHEVVYYLREVRNDGYDVTSALLVIYGAPLLLSG